MDVAHGYFGYTETHWWRPTVGGWRRRPGEPLWTVRYHFAEQDGRAVCVGIDVRGFDERTKDGMLPRMSEQLLPVSRQGSRLEPVPAALMREIPLGKLMGQAAVSQLRTLEARGTELSDRATEALAAFRRYRKRRRPMYDDDHFRAVAEIYAKDTSGTPTQAVAERFRTSRSAAAKWVARARDKGFLPPARGQGAH